MCAPQWPEVYVAQRAVGSCQITAVPPASTGGGAKRRSSFLNKRVGDKRGKAKKEAKEESKKKAAKKKSRAKEKRAEKEPSAPIDDYEAQPWYAGTRFPAGSHRAAAECPPACCAPLTSLRAALQVPRTHLAGPGHQSPAGRSRRVGRLVPRSEEHQGAQRLCRVVCRQDQTVPQHDQEGR